MSNQRTIPTYFDSPKLIKNQPKIDQLKNKVETNMITKKNIAKWPTKMEQVNRSSHEGKKTNEIVDFGSFVTTLAKPLP